MPSRAVLYDPTSAEWLRFDGLGLVKGGLLVTPPLTCGLLPGSYREFLVRRGVLTEAVISREDLANADRIYLVNAVRKWRRGELRTG